MRTKKSIINSLYSIVSYALIAIAGLGVRKLFLNNFSIEYLGYESLFGSIFVLLSVAEMGAGSLFNYKLYAAIAQKDEKEISILMAMYKQLYRIIGAIVLIMGLVLFLALPMLFKSNNQNWTYVQVVYIAQLATTLTTYFLAYKRSIIIANQCEYQVVQIETGFRIFNLFLKAIIILVFKSYLGYVLISVVTNIVTNIAIAAKCKINYPYIKNEKITVEDYKIRDVFVELKNLFISRIATTIYTTSDNVIITIIMGINTTALYGNYALISNMVCNIFYKVIFPVTASIGNLINAGDKEKSKSFYKAYDLFFMFLASFVFIAFVVLFQPTISVLFGNQYVMSMPFVIAFSLNNYVNFKQLAPSAYRSLVGNYDGDKFFSIAAAVLNIVLSFGLGVVWGIEGICAATVVGHCAIWAGRVKVTSDQFSYFSYGEVLIKEVLEFLLVLVELMITFALCRNFGYTWLGIIIRILVCLIVPTSINLAIYHKKSEFKYLIAYMKNTFKTILKFKK